MACTKRSEVEMKRKFQKKLKTCQDPVELIRAHCFANGVTGLKSLTRAFNKADKDKSGTLNYQEFKTIIIRTGLTMDEKILQKAFNALDVDNDHILSIEETLAALRPPMTMHRRQLICNVFRKLDRDRSGAVTVDDIQGVYNAKKHAKYLNGEWSEERVFREFLKTFDTRNRDGKITEDEFTDYYLALSASIDNDAHFDLVMRQAWGL